MTQSETTPLRRFWQNSTKGVRPQLHNQSAAAILGIFFNRSKKDLLRLAESMLYFT